MSQDYLSEALCGITPPACDDDLNGNCYCYELTQCRGAGPPYTAQTEGLGVEGNVEANITMW